MLLDEFSAPDRGNTVQSAIGGFKKFWVFTDSVTFVPTLLEGERSTPIQGKSLDKLLSAELARDSNGTLTASILEEWGKDTPYPQRLLVVVGPRGATPHAVAFLFTREGPTDEPTCYYANTGLGAKKCGPSLIQTTRRWNGAKIIPLIEYARRTVFTNDEFSKYIEFLEEAPGSGFIDACPLWDASVNDRMLSLAQYAESGGAIVSFPQRGGTCAYNCILWLVGGVLMKKDAAVGAERSMKLRGMRHLAAYRPRADNPYRVETRNCLRVMEATACAYEGSEWCEAEVAALAHAVDDSFDIMSKWMEGSSDYREYKRMLPEPKLHEIDFDVGSASFETVREAALWSDRAYNWIIKGTVKSPSIRHGGSKLDSSHVPLYYLFLHKARNVMCVNPVFSAETSETIILISKFLVRCRGSITDEVARGMLVRCARLAAISLRSEANADTRWEVLLRSNSTGSTRVSSLPWVAQEYRQLRDETTGLAHLLVTGDIAGGTSEPLEADFSCEGGVSFEKHPKMSHHVWNAFASKMKDPSHAALNIALIFLGSWGSEWGYGAQMTLYSCGQDFRFLADGDTMWRAIRLVVEKGGDQADPFGLFHGEPDILEAMRTYMHLSTLDAAAMSTQSAPRFTSPKYDAHAPAAMVVPIWPVERVAIGDVDELDRWGELEHTKWSTQLYDQESLLLFSNMASRRGLAYCAAKFLTPACRRRGPLANLETLIDASKEDKDSALFRALQRGKVHSLVARLRASGPLEPHETLALHYAVARGLVSQIMPLMIAVRRTGPTVDGARAPCSRK